MLKRFYRDQSKDLWRFDEVHPRVNVPTCQLTGWYDRLIGTINNYTGVVEKGPGELRDQHRIVIGPWGHNVGNMSRSFGPWDLGPEAESTYAAEILRWYDYQFKRIDTGLGAEPPIKLFVLGENRWRFENEWPLARTRFTDFFLHSDGSANTPAGDGVLLEEPLGEGKPDRYDYDPKDPVMSLMGLNSQAAPRGQTSLANRRDILVYQTLPLAEDVEVTGPVELKLWASSTAPDTDFTAKLVDVWPDGTAVNLTYGILRAQYRDGFDTPKLLEPENPYELKISLNPTCVLFKRGHRIRLDVSSSDFPNFDRNHNTGNDFWSDTELRVARQTVFHDGERRSRLVLPVIPR